MGIRRVGRGATSRARNVAPVWLQQPMRLLMNLLRSIPDLVVGTLFIVAVGLVIALAFSMLITAFTTDVINPIVAAAGGKKGNGLGFYVSKGNPKTFVDIGSFISAIIYFLIFIPFKTESFL